MRNSRLQYVWYDAPKIGLYVIGPDILWFEIDPG